MTAELPTLSDAIAMSLVLSVPVAYIVWWVFIGRHRPTWRDAWYASNRAHGWRGGPFPRNQEPWSAGEWNDIPFSIQVHKVPGAVDNPGTETIFRAFLDLPTDATFEAVSRTFLNRLSHPRQMRTGFRAIDKRLILAPGSNTALAMAVFGDAEVQARLFAVGLPRWVFLRDQPFSIHTDCVTLRRRGEQRHTAKRLQQLERLVLLAESINAATSQFVQTAGKRSPTAIGVTDASPIPPVPAGHSPRDNPEEPSTATGAGPIVE